jgi:hypothetical protein
MLFFCRSTARRFREVQVPVSRSVQHPAQLQHCTVCHYHAHVGLGAIDPRRSGCSKCIQTVGFAGALELPERIDEMIKERIPSTHHASGRNPTSSPRMWYTLPSNLRSLDVLDFKICCIAYCNQLEGRLAALGHEFPRTTCLKPGIDRRSIPKN